MGLLLDQGLPHSTVVELSGMGIASTHVADLAMSSSTDQAILRHAADHGQVVVSLDSDFHALLAKSGASKPSVIRIRIEGLKAPALAVLLKQVIDHTREEIERGAVVSVTASSIRVRFLPIGAKPR